MKVLTDAEFTAKLTDLTHQIAGLKAEADARRELSVATDLAEAGETLALAGRRWKSHHHTLRPWEFWKPDFSVGVCSWCEQEFGHVPSALESHGICPRHLDLMRMQIRERRAA